MATNNATDSKVDQDTSIYDTPMEVSSSSNQPDVLNEVTSTNEEIVSSVEAGSNDAICETTETKSSPLVVSVKADSGEPTGTPLNHPTNTVCMETLTSPSTNTVCMETLTSPSASLLPSLTACTLPTVSVPQICPSDPIDEFMNESDANESISFPSVAQDLSTLALTSQFDQEDLNECSNRSSSEKSTGTNCIPTGPLCSTLKSIESNSPPPKLQLENLLTDIPSPQVQEGWFLSGTELSNEECGSPHVFMCGNIVTAVTSQPLTLKGKQQVSCINNTEEYCEPVDEEDTMIEDNVSEHGNINEAEIDISDFDQVASPQSTLSSDHGHEVLLRPTKSSAQQVDIIIPDICIPEILSERKISYHPKVSKFRKSSKTDIQSGTVDFSPVVIDLRPSCSGKRSVSVEQATDSVTKKLKQMKDSPLGGDSTFAVKIDLHDSMKKGVF